MSIHKRCEESMMRGNHYIDRVITKEGTEHGWLLNQPEWVQYCIIIYSEERARKEEKRHTTALKKYGEHLLTRFRKDVEEQQRKEWKRYESSVKYHAMIYTKECFRTMYDVDKALTNLNKKQTRAMIKHQFKIWEEGGGWNEDFALQTAEFLPDIIHKFEKGTLLKATSKAKPGKILWPHIH